jgi:hypothetical protein
MVTRFPNESEIELELNLIDHKKIGEDTVSSAFFSFFFFLDFLASGQCNVGVDRQGGEFLD